MNEIPFMHNQEKIIKIIKVCGLSLPHKQSQRVCAQIDHSRWLSVVIIITLDEEVSDPSPFKMVRTTLSYTQGRMHLKHKLVSGLASDTDF